jgi:hypothetical protein
MAEDSEAMYIWVIFSTLLQEEHSILPRDKQAAYSVNL